MYCALVGCTSHSNDDLSELAVVLQIAMNFHHVVELECAIDNRLERAFRGSLPDPTQPLCTLRVRRHRRLTQHSLPGGSLSLTWAGLAPADRASFAWRLPSLDHLVGAPEQSDWEGNTKRPGSLEID
jgi:hypothetical protein